MPGPLLTAKQIAPGAVTFQKRTFGNSTGKAREARVWFSFTTANVPVAMPHGLGRVPTSFQVAGCGGVDVAGSVVTVNPGTVYSASKFPGQTLWASRTHIVLACSLGNKWAEVIIR